MRGLVVVGVQSVFSRAEPGVVRRWQRVFSHKGHRLEYQVLQKIGRVQLEGRRERAVRVRLQPLCARDVSSMTERRGDVRDEQRAGRVDDLRVAEKRGEELKQVVGALVKTGRAVLRGAWKDRLFTGITEAKK